MDERKPGLFGQIKEKLIARKEDWAKEGRLLTGESRLPGRDRLPPGQREVKDWPVLDLGLKPDIPLDYWRLRIDGLVSSPVTLDWSAFQALSQTRHQADIHCVTSWSLYDSLWQGVTAQDLLRHVPLRPEAKYVIAHSQDGYTTNLTLADFQKEGSMLVSHRNGAPLSAEHGGPVRLLIPHLYFWKSAKWLKRLEFLAEDRPGFWEVRGYHNRGDPWNEERYS